MKDYLKDLLEYTSVGGIELVRVSGTAEETSIFSRVEKDLVLHGKFHQPVAEFIGTFGMPNLAKLKILLNLTENQENARLSVSHRSDTGEPESVTFSNSSGDFNNTYRFMGAALINNAISVLPEVGPTWHIEFTPSVAAIQRLRMQTQANSEEPFFQLKTIEKNLQFHFGSPSTHAGNFIFQADVGYEIKTPSMYPAATVNEILSRPGDKTIKVSDGLCMQIVVDSGLGSYWYTIPAQSK